MTHDRTPAQAELGEGDGPYKVVVEYSGCEHCGDGRVYDIEHTEGGVEHGLSGFLSDEEEANAWTRELNHAYALGLAVTTDEALRAEILKLRASYETACTAALRASDARDAATTELAHVRVELEAMRIERDQALESRDAIASAHGVLVVEVMRLREQVRSLEENNRNLATVIALSSERGQA